MEPLKSARPTAIPILWSWTDGGSGSWRGRRSPRLRHRDRRAPDGWAAFCSAILFGGGKGQNIEGPRLEDLSVQTSTYVAPMPLVYGTMRISGNVIWSTSIKETKSERVGGKGGKKSTQTTRYSAHSP